MTWSELRSFMRKRFRADIRDLERIYVPISLVDRGIEIIFDKLDRYGQNVLVTVPVGDETELPAKLALSGGIVELGCSARLEDGKHGLRRTFYLPPLDMLLVLERLEQMIREAQRLRSSARQSAPQLAAA